MTNVQELEKLGQSIWYDNISRSLLRSGRLQKLVDEGLLGVTSNPTIFEKAISGSTDYDDHIGRLLTAQPGISNAEIIRALMVDDIRTAAEVLLPVYRRTNGRDGYVSIEVTPSKARDTEGTIREARELWDRVGAPNIMIKIPATREGLPAITKTIGDGINVNVTLIFPVGRYREVADAYLAGLEERLRRGKPLTGVASVASVFVSRIDTMVDGLLESHRTSGPTPAEAGRAERLMGKAAVANTRMVYQAFRDTFSQPRFLKLQSRGASVQRPLWGSTGTKNPAYSDLLYVDSLIGPSTVNTVPPATYDAILDHCTVQSTIESGLDDARKIPEQLKEMGIDLEEVVQTLERDGVAAFEKSFDGLARHIDTKAAAARTGSRQG